MKPLAILVSVLVAAGVAMAMPADRAYASGRPSAAELESELVCVTCKTTLDESNSPIAQRMKAYIRRRIGEGASAKQIKDELVAEFGEEVLATPPTHGFDLLAWLLPIGGICGGAIVLGGLAWTWARRRDGSDSGDGPPGTESLDPELERRVDEALARFDG